MWITRPAETSFLLHFTTFVGPMQEVATYTDYKALYEESQLVIAQLRHELDQLKKMIFGSRQERFIPGQSNDPSQLSMGLPAEQVVATSLIKAKKINIPVERKAADEQLSEADILHLRQEKAKPTLESLGKWMQRAYVEVLPKSAIGTALAYSIQREWIFYIAICKWIVWT